MYVDDSVQRGSGRCRKIAQEFESTFNQPRPELFGQRAIAGIDGDPRLTILNTPLHGAGGYFSSADGVSRPSIGSANEREMFIIALTPIHSAAMATPRPWAQFQHMIE